MLHEAGFVGVEAGDAGVGYLGCVQARLGRWSRKGDVGVATQRREASLCAASHQPAQPCRSSHTTGWCTLSAREEGEGKGKERPGVDKSVTLMTVAMITSTEPACLTGCGTPFHSHDVQ